MPVKAAAKAEGEDVSSKLLAYERANAEVIKVQEQIAARAEELAVMTQQREHWDRELLELRGLGGP